MHAKIFMLSKEKQKKNTNFRIIPKITVNVRKYQKEGFKH